MAAQALTPDTPKEKIEKAVRRGEKEKLKALLDFYPDIYTSRGLLDITVINYIDGRYPDVPKVNKMAVITDILSNGVDITDGGENKLLSYIVRSSSLKPDECLELATLMFNHGASAKNIDLSQYAQSIIASIAGKNAPTYRGLIELLLSHDANPNQVEKGRRPALLTFVMKNYFDLAELLLAHGADPNAGEDQKSPSGLVDLASYCKPLNARYTTKERMDSYWTSCLESTAAQARFLIEHGADVNGKASVQNG